jgi:hypothetical protein
MGVQSYEKSFVRQEITMIINRYCEGVMGVMKVMTTFSLQPSA